MENKIKLVNSAYDELLNDNNSDVANLIKIKRAVNNLSSKNQIFFVQNKVDDKLQNDVNRIKEENKELKEMLLKLVDIMRTILT